MFCTDGQRLTFRFRNFLVSKLLPIFWGYRFRFRKIWYRKKSLGIDFGKLGIGKKVSVSVSENLVSEKKSRYRFQKIWYRKKSLGIGFGKNFGIVIQWCLRVPGDVEHHHVLLPLVSSLTAHLPLAVGRVEHLSTISSERGLMLPWGQNVLFLGLHP